MEYASPVQAIHTILVVYADQLCPTSRDDEPIPDDLVLYVTPNSLTSCTRNPRRYPPNTVRIPPLFVMCDTNAEMLALTQ